MSRQATQQLNIRSAFARQRVRDIAARTGMTATEIIEDALRGYQPPGQPEPVGRLVREGRLLVLPAPPGRKPGTTEELLDAIDAAREARLDDIMNADGE